MHFTTAGHIHSHCDGRASLSHFPAVAAVSTPGYCRFGAVSRHTCVMADRGDRPIRTGPERIRKLAQAALNADVTVEQVDTILEGLSETLEDLNHSTGNLDATLERFNETINQINELAPRLHGVVDRMEGVVARVERIVEMGESVISPLAATEQVVRGAIDRVRRTAGLQ